MADSILVPFEGSPLSTRALEIALADYPDADVTVLYVMDPITAGTNIFDVMLPFAGDGAPPGSVSDRYWEEWYEGAREEAEAVFETARSIAGEHGRSVSTEIAFGDPGRKVVEYAEGHDVDRIVMGSHARRGAERFLVGSVASHVVERGPVPVLIVR